MRQSRIHTSLPLAAVDSIELTGAASHYLARVLRLSEGDPVTLFNGDGKDYLGEVLDIQPKRVRLKLLGSSSPDNESPLKITLAQAISRGERMDYSLQKATELGVFCIQPLISRRVEVRLDDKRQAKRLAHWQGVVISACEQSGRAVVPEVRLPQSFAEWLSVADDSLRLILDPTAQVQLSSFSSEEQAVSILVGPEGGFTDEEIAQAQASGVTAVSLGPRVLRTESAGPAAIAVLQVAAGDF